MIDPTRLDNWITTPPEDSNRYRWPHPSEWLADKLASAGEDALRAYANALAGQLDGDQVQDLFQNEMDADGYFDPIAEADDAEDDPRNEPDRDEED